METARGEGGEWVLQQLHWRLLQPQPQPNVCASVVTIHNPGVVVTYLQFPIRKHDTIDPKGDDGTKKMQQRSIVRLLVVLLM